ncbi:MAG: HAD family hydrolase [Acidimicrobiia bacterium]
MSVEVLASWSEGSAKDAVIDFVVESARHGSSGFIPTVERIAAFDNDGTLWVEQPMPVQAPFLLEKLVAQVRADPSLADEQPYSGIVNHDEEFLRGLAQQVPDAVLAFLKGVGAAWEGTTPDEYETEVREYLATHTHERFGRPYTDLVYIPMMELFELLRTHDWRVYICSGGGRDFMRVIAEDTWGIGKENVIGSAPEFVYKEGKLVRENSMRGNLALGAGKPEHLFARTGRLPRFAAGNGDVDIEMLEVADFGLVVVHDDKEREYAYTEAAEQILDLGPDHGWTMASMRDDWVTVFDQGGMT